MKYFFVSDIHGQFNKLTEALQAAGFQSEQDTLVNLGDSFDRGPQSKEVLEYLINLPHKILVWGNHDLRLKETYMADDDGSSVIQYYDYSNGMLETLKSFIGITSDDMPIGVLMYMLKTNPDYKQVKDNLIKYFQSCVYALEFKDLIGCHAWLPFNIIYAQYGNGQEYDRAILIKDWRNLNQIKYAKKWYEASWANVEICIKSRAFPDKDMIIGHWHAWRIAEKFGEKRIKGPGDRITTKTPIDCSMFKLTTNKNTLILIDGCTNLGTGKVNVFIYESDEDPVLYKLTN